MVVLFHDDLVVPFADRIGQVVGLIYRLAGFSPLLSYLLSFISLLVHF